MYEIYQSIISSKINFENPVFKEFSPLLIDLIKICLTLDPKDRITTSDALEHPWFKLLLFDL